MKVDVETLVDADYKAEDRHSVSGEAASSGGALVSWFSMTQKSVTLSSTQADYVATADGDKEALSVRRTLAFLMTREGVGEHWRVRGQQEGDRLSQNRNPCGCPILTH